MDWFRGKSTGNHRFSHLIFGLSCKISLKPVHWHWNVWGNHPLVSASWNMMVDPNWLIKIGWPTKPLKRFLQTNYWNNLFCKTTTTSQPGWRSSLVQLGGVPVGWDFDTCSYGEIHLFHRTPKQLSSQKSGPASFHMVGFCKATLLVQGFKISTSCCHIFDCLQPATVAMFLQVCGLCLSHWAACESRNSPWLWKIRVLPSLFEPVGNYFPDPFLPPFCGLKAVHLDSELATKILG